MKAMSAPISEFRAQLVIDGQTTTQIFYQCLAIQMDLFKARQVSKVLLLNLHD